MGVSFPRHIDRSHRYCKQNSLENSQHKKRQPRLLLIPHSIHDTIPSSQDKNQVQTKSRWDYSYMNHHYLISERLELPYEEPHLGIQDSNIIEASARSVHVESIKWQAIEWVWTIIRATVLNFKTPSYNSQKFEWKSNWHVTNHRLVL